MRSEDCGGGRIGDCPVALWVAFGDGLRSHEAEIISGMAILAALGDLAVVATKKTTWPRISQIHTDQDSFTVWH